ncbi:MAG TPA: SusC/RagA family TonB-linked outer membrane protein [Longimicrobiaceae bacterium]|nr:SusC/RagA family TonB-linked outer membrane protein [Longimicrobiaceae bacterium]
MSKIRWILAIALAVASLPVQALAQGGETITGRVTDQQQQPIAGAQVLVVGGTARAVTGQDGSYRLAGVRSGSVQVSATRIGYDTRTQTVAVPQGGTATANFTLTSSALEIGGLVVTASGREQRQRELGNAVSTINTEKVEMSAVNNMASLLQGRSAGVTVLQSGGTTGTGARVRIRGSNSVSLSNDPLIIVDGVRANDNAESFTIATGGQSPSRLNDINPEDIESIEVLKGPAAAALYGTAAANGVIQITTKRGRSGKPRWSAYTEQGTIQERNAYPDNVGDDFGVDLAGDQGRFCSVVDQGMDFCEVGPLVRFNALRNPETTPFVDGRRHKYGASVSGGSDAVTYYVSGDLEEEQGIFRINELDRISLRTNLTSRVTEKLNLAIKGGYVTSDVILPQNDNNFGGVHLNGNLGHPDTINFSRGGWYDIRPSEFFEQLSGQEVRRLTVGVNANYQPLEWLSIVGTSGLDQVNRHDDYFNRPNVTDRLGPNVLAGIRESNRVETTNLTHTLDVTGKFSPRENVASTTSTGLQFHREEYHDTRGRGVGVVPGTKSLGGTTRLFRVNENTVENATFGAYVQQQFAINDRLFLTGSVRGDQNSAFGTDIGFVTYPSLSASWVVSEEPFFPQAGFLSSLRLRSAYGQSGLRPSFRDAITFFEPVSAKAAGSDVPAITLAGAGNRALRPEIATEIELGLDASFFGERIGLELTRYDKQSDDALIRRRLAPSVGAVTTRFENIGSVTNSGWEAVLNARLIDRARFQWDATVTGTTNQNELVELGEGVEPIFLAFSQRHVAGFPLGGFWQRPLTYSDENGDGFLQLSEITQGDTAVFMGAPFPTREASFTSSVSLFNVVRVSGLLDYKGGHKVLNYTRMDRCAWEMVCEETYVKEKATIDDQAGWIAWNVFGRNVAPYIEDGDFVKLRELSLSFSVPDNLTQRFGTSGLRLTLSGRNLKTWTDYRGLDPEVNTFGQRNFDSADYHNQPPVRYYTARIDVNF